MLGGIAASSFIIVTRSSWQCVEFPQKLAYLRADLLRGYSGLNRDFILGIDVNSDLTNDCIIIIDHGDIYHACVGYESVELGPTTVFANKKAHTSLLGLGIHS